MGKFLSCMKSADPPRESFNKNKPPSTGKNDIYSVVKDYHLPNRLNADFWTLPSRATPEDRLAKALVFLNVYLSTEVICPAIDRFNRNEHIYRKERKLKYH